MSASLNYPRRLAGELFRIQINTFISSVLPKEQINLTKWSHHCLNTFVQAWQGSLLDDWPCPGVHVWGGLLQVQISISLKELMFEIGFSRPHVAFPLSVFHCFSSNSIQRSSHPNTGGGQEGSDERLWSRTPVLSIRHAGFQYFDRN